jgi:GntR family transcriptional regulator/MocR family aminotransferase
MRIPLNKKSREPLYRQIHQFLRDEIRCKALPADFRLPSSRTLSAGLGVSRITVMNAYAELESEGLVHIQPGSGTYVAPPAAYHSLPAEDGLDVHDWPIWQQELLSRTWLPARREMERLLASTVHPDPISFAGDLVAENLFPADEFRKTINAVLRRDGQQAFGYGNRAGFAPLRETIAHILAGQGIPTSPDHVLITSGSQQALSLVAQVLVQAGGSVLVESPTYIGAIDLFRSLNVRLMGVPVDEEGMRIEAVEEALKRNKPRLIYTIPAFHNPTGVCMAADRRRRLINLASRYNVPILEDDCFGDLRYDGRALPALKALDPNGCVIYVNTFSKMLMPGLRVGYLVASGPLYDRLLSCKYTCDLATSNLIQRALEAYISVGRYQAHLRRACGAYRKRRDAMVAALDAHMPEGVRWRVPKGGLCLWLRLPDGVSAIDLLPEASEEGVVYAPGSFYFPAERPESFMRLNFAPHTPERTEEGIRRLARALERYLSRRKAEEEPQRLHMGVTV